MPIPRSDPLRQLSDSTTGDAQQVPPIAARSIRNAQISEGFTVPSHALDSHTGGAGSIGAAPTDHSHAPLNNYAAATSPGVNDDETKGYAVGSEWVDIVGAATYKCVDATAGAASWTQTDSSGAHGTGDWDAHGDVTLTSEAQGEIIYYNGTAFVNLAVGTSGQVLTTNGAAANPSWEDASGGGHTIRENGTDQTARTGLNFIDASAGAGLITDDAGGDETEVNLDLYILADGARAFGGNVSFGEFNITNVGDIALDSISADATTIEINSDTIIAGAASPPAPDSTLHVWDGDATQTAPAGTLLTVEHSGNAYINVLSGATSAGAVYFGDSGSATAGGIIYDHNAPGVTIRAETQAVAVFTTTGLTMQDLDITNVGDIELDTISDDATSTTQITVSSSSPQVIVENNFRVDGYTGLQGSTPASSSALTINPSGLTDTTYFGINLSPAVAMTTASNQVFRGLSGAMTVSSAASSTGHTLYGLFFNIGGSSSSTATITYTDIAAVFAQAQAASTGSSATTNVTTITGVDAQILLRELISGTVAATTGYGVRVRDISTLGSPTITTYYGLAIEDVTLPTNSHLLEVGGTIGTTPNFRVGGNFTYAANETPLWIAEGATPTLRQLKTVVESSLDTASGTKLICYLA